MSPTLVIQLLFVTVMVTITVIIHLFGLGLLLAGLRFHARFGSKLGARFSQVLILLILLLVYRRRSGTLSIRTIQVLVIANRLVP